MKQKQMKKYYLQGTAEEVKIGDMIVLDLTEDMPKGKVKHHHMEVKFLPPLIPLLLEQGIIEVQEVKEKKKKETSKTEDNFYIILQKMIHINELLNKRMDALEELVAKLSLSLAYNPTPVNSPKPHRNAKKAGRK